jgi:hemolysin activation/secretion protein
LTALRRLCAGAVLCWHGLVPAQGPPEAPRFAIARFEVVGATLVSPERIEQALRPFTGAARTVADVQAARAALEAIYAELGYGAAQVSLPEQEIREGVVRLSVAEGRVARVVLDGNRHYDDANIRRSVPALEEGRPLNTARLAANLRLANESPVKQTTVTLKPGEQPGELDAEVRVTDQRPWRVSLALDNTGTPETGDYRIGVGFQHANVFDRDHVLTLQYVTSPSRESNPSSIALPPNDNVLIFGAGYHIPLPGLGDSIDLVAGYANVDSGVVQNLFNISGSGRVYAARYNFNLPPAGAYEHRLSPGIDRRYYDNDVVPVGGTGGIVPDYVVTPLSLAYGGVYRGEARELAFTVIGVHNLPGGANGDQATFDAVRPGAPANYTLGRGNLNFVQRLPRDFQGRLRLSGQYTRDELVPGEQFGIGGMDSVRGFYERQFIGDRGFSGSLELYSPDLGPQLPVNGLRVRLLAFYDYGRVVTVDPDVFETPATSISSFGPGLRVAYRTDLSLRFDYGFQLQSGVPGVSGRSQANFSFAWVF